MYGSSCQKKCQMNTSVKVVGNGEDRKWLLVSGCWLLVGLENERYFVLRRVSEAFSQKFLLGKSPDLRNSVEENSTENCFASTSWSFSTAHDDYSNLQPLISNL